MLFHNFSSQKKSAAKIFWVQLIAFTQSQRVVGMHTFSPQKQKIEKTEKAYLPGIEIIFLANLTKSSDLGLGENGILNIEYLVNH